MTGVQPRPMRYRGRLNRRGRNWRKLWVRAYADRFNQALNDMEARTSRWRGLMDRNLEDEFRG